MDEPRTTVHEPRHRHLSAHHRARGLAGAIVCLVVVWTATASAQTGARLSADSGWPDEATATLNTFIEQYGRGSATFDPAQPPVAVFDWDNTVIYHDIGAATVHWMIEHGLVRQPPGADWRVTSPHLTEAAALALGVACGDAVPGGERLPTDTDLACADALRRLYDDGELPEGAPAFAGYDHRRFRGTTSWQQVLLAGYTPAEVRGLAAEVMATHLAAPLGTTRRVGNDTSSHGDIRINEPVRELMRVLADNGFDVWVVSASPHAVVEGVANRVEIPFDHVIGIQGILDEDGRFTYGLAGCGGIADGSNQLLTYIEGKRCWINQRIYGIEGAAALARAEDPTRRPALVAGDATTDISMLLDATGVRIVFDRNYEELMCHALHGQGAPWVIVDPFWGTRVPRESPYPCASTACVARDGSRVPCLDESGSTIPDYPPRP